MSEIRTRKRRYNRLLKDLPQKPVITDAEVDTAIVAWYDADETFMFLTATEKKSAERRMRAALEAAAEVRPS
jgi:protease II